MVWDERVEEDRELQIVGAALRIERGTRKLSEEDDRKFAKYGLERKAPFTRYNLFSNRLSSRFDNRLNVCIHDTTGCQAVDKHSWFDNRLYRVNGV